jgi:schlafen family protein
MTAEFLGRFLKKHEPSEVTYADFEAFIRQRIEEHQNLEYKPRGLLVRRDGTVIPTFNPREIIGFSALAKSVASLANSEGGLLVLGVKEKPESHKGTVVKIRPGTVTPLPLTVTREAIENHLLSKIQYPVEALTIVPLRKSPRSKAFVYLIDVPQSHRAPHRVNELYYFQRYNFTTYEMKHYQIADLFGRRFAPDLAIEVHRRKGMNEEKGHFTLVPILANRGRAVAKYVTCLCEIVQGPYRVFQAKWAKHDGEKSCQYQTGANIVIYPDVSTDTGYIELAPEDETKQAPVVLRFGIYAEGMIGRKVEIRIKLTEAV